MLIQVGVLFDVVWCCGGGVDIVCVVVMWCWTRSFEVVWGDPGLFVV